MNILTLNKINSISGKVTLPGSKSLSNRALLLAALAQGKTRLVNVLESDDTACMLRALAQLGVKLSSQRSYVDVQGLGGAFNVGLDRITVDLGNAGTAMRPLCAALACSEGCFVLTGEERMQERPIGPLTEALRELGLNVEYLNNPGFPPLQVWGQQPSSHEVTIDGSVSSQFVTALLMAGPLLHGLTIHVRGDLISKPYVDLTIRLMETFGAQVKRTGYSSFEVADSPYVSPETYFIEGDASGATYFAAAAAVAGEVEIFGIGSHTTQGDAGFLKVLEQMGALVEYKEDSVVVRKHRLDGIEVDMNAMPDAAMTLVPLSMFTQGPVTITNIASWRVKETDRIEAMVNEMSKLGVKVKSGKDFISLDASSRNSEEVEFATYKDHRMAMCMSLIALERRIRIQDPDCVKKTFPNYFSLLQSISH
ncbi:MAG: 3-phosphoshikimate 1-carboxyvinyltransferase [Succinivibrio sp.]|nr:3-phosphoshikimate 1-carboxyvinyltransferase [Succinivibrio sp.]